MHALLLTQWTQHTLTVHPKKGGDGDDANAEDDNSFTRVLIMITIVASMVIHKCLHIQSLHQHQDPFITAVPSSTTVSFNLSDRVCNVFMTIS